jgi:hypothetical protein
MVYYCFKKKKKESDTAFEDTDEPREYYVHEISQVQKDKCYMIPFI